MLLCPTHQLGRAGSNFFGKFDSMFSFGPIDYFELLVSVLIPMIFVGVGVCAARLGRRDGDSSPQINSFAVGTTVAIMCLSTAIVSLFDAPLGQREHLLWWVVGFIVLAFWSIDRDRYASWDRDQFGKPTETKHLWRGVIMPILVTTGLYAAFHMSV